MSLQLESIFSSLLPFSLSLLHFYPALPSGELSAVQKGALPRSDSLETIQVQSCWHCHIDPRKERCPKVLAPAFSNCSNCRRGTRSLPHLPSTGAVEKSLPLIRDPWELQCCERWRLLLVISFTLQFSVFFSQCQNSGNGTQWL